MSRRVAGANERISFGVIGCGGQGMVHVRKLRAMAAADPASCEVIAVCDVYEARKERAERITDGKLYGDHRELLADPDVDAVVIATPEHLHASMAIDALEAGKHVYLEKPMTRHLDEAERLYRLASRSPCVLQVGAQWTSEPRWRVAQDLLGDVGQVVWSQTSYCRNSRGGEWNWRVPKDATAETVDWPRFLGPAPAVPFDPVRFIRWRKYWDYSSGICGELFPHSLYKLLMVLGPELPCRVAAAGGTYVHKDREIPDTFHLLAEFPSGHTLFVAGSTANERGVSTMIMGHEATMYLGGSNILVKPERPYVEDLAEIRERAPGSPDPLRLHHQNFQDCIRSGATPNCGLELAYAGMVIGALAEMSLRESKVMLFDPDRRQVIA